MQVRRNSDITNYYIQRKKNNDDNNNINNNINILNNKNSKEYECLAVSILKNKYNNLDTDTREVLDHTSDLLRVISNLESSLSRVKRKYNELQSSLRCYKDRIKTLEKQAEQAVSCLPAENICCVCMTKPRDCVYTSCGHFSACSECCTRMGEKCPICRTNSPFVKLIAS